MGLSSSLAKHFSHNSRARGEEYYRQNRVRVNRGGESEVVATVRGAERYEVELIYQDGALSLFCDCQHFQDGFACKHLWATILAAENEGHLSAAASVFRVVLDGDDPALDFDSDEQPEAWNSARRPVYRSPRQAEASSAKSPHWKEQITGLINSSAEPGRPGDLWPAKRGIRYLVDVPRSLSKGALILLLEAIDRKGDGTPGKPKPLSMKRSWIPQLGQRDREIVAVLTGSSGADYYYAYGYGYGNSYGTLANSFHVPDELSLIIVPMLVRTGRCYLRLQPQVDAELPLEWDEREWEFGLELGRSDRACRLTGMLHRGEERMELSVARLITTGCVFTDRHVAPLAKNTPFRWISYLRNTASIEVPAGDADKFLAELLCAPNLPPLKVPDELRYEEVTTKPHFHLKISTPRYANPAARLPATLSFDYDAQNVTEFDAVGGFFDASTRRLLRRDVQAEKSAGTLLDELGVKARPAYWNEPPGREVTPSKLPRVVHELVQAGWHVEAEGKIFRRATAFRLGVSSGVDWFELQGEADYGSCAARLPALLEALRRGEKMVRLGDGTYGVLPEEWLRRIGPLAAMGVPGDGHIRFERSQSGLLDALLAAQPEATCDETFARLRQELRRFHGVEAAAQPAGFVGQLRRYQCEGLGWMHFLRTFCFGGCLADDMGVGKTAQVLALLETRRERRSAGEAIGPSLVVAPRSLVFNWIQEAARFTPQLRMLDYSGIARNGEKFDSFDVILATYGTVRRDVLRLKDFAFDYVILDEAQAVKNADSDSSKAVRLLRGAHRLALSGTPVENHLGELWTLFEFLNPGMLGAASAFRLVGGSMRNPNEETRRLLAHALRPFILRRTKEQVARELPSKSEQTVYCELEAEQRKLYNELRQHYRAALLKRVEREGLAKAKILVLEALLRLRQAACHPGMLDQKLAGNSSAKLEALLEQLREVLEEGHKALVFSQFTSLLRIVRDRLDRSGITYTYLDGATRDRQARVERFQKDERCPLFLISLKAGGLGLNLTAAEYVFILDPWWNPAVEAQAVDRTHRIGQTRPVFAYRLIARDTIEEKVLQLQNAKRDLAASIIGADNSLIRNLRPEDLELLLS
jgi:superfamily II DNA or RNA helicase